MHIVSGHDVTAPIYSSVGVPEGDCLSPILFALFISDVEEYLHHRAPVMGGNERKSIFFADDGAIIAISAEELQKGLDGFAEYCKKNRRTRADSESGLRHQWREDRGREGVQVPWRHPISAAVIFQPPSSLRVQS